MKISLLLNIPLSTVSGIITKRKLRTTATRPQSVQKSPIVCRVNS
ncbi:unnamed protein product [Staurois parvus]|uniref:Uncharacterized protein n=1 Tax=Staurois parvus TaxID=386267 RepID=A0ABN9G434_9NEOB|nr:unnamed protein product [Staurois parvus]